MAAAACVAATLTVAVAQAPTQHYAGVSSVRTNSLRAVAPVVRSQTAVQAFSADAPVVHDAAGFDATWNPQPNTSKAAALFGSAALLLGAAVAFARQAVAPHKPEAVALLSATGETVEESKLLMKKMVENLDPADLKLVARGASMEEVAKSRGIDEVATAIRADQASRKDLTPKDVILEMQRGNGRFWMGISERPDMNAMQRRALIMSQAPKICVLSCADSRVPVEIIFDQGLGEIFVVRTAGNILDSNAHGSIEYAVKYLGVKVIMVIGHEACGAVKGAISMSAQQIGQEPFDLQVVLQSIKANLDVNELNLISDTRSREREAIIQNTSIQVKTLQQNKLIAEAVDSGKLLVCGAFYEISSGIVDLFSLDKNGFVVEM